MKYKSFNCSIDQEFTKELCAFLSEGGKKTIYLNTQGGKYDEAIAAVHMINQQKKDITLVGVGKLFSAGFRIFYSVECKKELADGCTGMWHQPNVDVTLDGKGRIDNISEKHAKESNRDVYKSTTVKIAKNLGFTKKELKKLKKNYYVYFRHKRMKELFHGKLS